MLDHYLEKLEFEGQLVVPRSSAYDKAVVCFLVEGAGLWENEATRILFGRCHSRAVGLYLVENPGKTTCQIAEARGSRL